MARISESVKNYTTVGKGAYKSEESLFDAIEYILNTLFDIRFSMKKKWGYEWYEDVRYGFYEAARQTLIKQAPCFTKTVALKCIDDLEALRLEMDRLQKGGNN